ncbi:hypothetical protein FOZ63_032833 [Perkinsus olseni]|uniref:Uncharacterized protein n=1 Tax=Perkinsus olseni TaxID=32597 RepID=A0A7J6QX83_PEROL|nr:hypothetical protein FOZ63_032833 [Perkinsus olseni]
MPVDSLGDLMQLDGNNDHPVTSTSSTASKDVCAATRPAPLPHPAAELCLSIVGHRALNIADTKAEYFTEVVYGHFYHETSVTVKTSLLRIPIHDDTGMIEIKIRSQVDQRCAYSLRIPLASINVISSAVVVDWYAITPRGAERLARPKATPTSPKNLLIDLPSTSIRSFSAPGSLAANNWSDLRAANERALGDASVPALRVAWRSTSTTNRQTMDEKPTVISYREMRTTMPFRRPQGVLLAYQPHPGDPVDSKISKLLQRRPDLSVICRIHRQVASSDQLVDRLRLNHHSSTRGAVKAIPLQAPGQYLLNGREVRLSVTDDPLHAESGGLSISEGPLRSQCLVPYLQGSCATAKYSTLPDEK